MIKCKHCGADIPFIPETQDYRCPYCDSVYTHDELTQMEKDGEIKAEEHVESQSVDSDQAGQKAEDDVFMDVYTYTCPQCGGELMTTEETMATFCSYCGASVLLERSRSKEPKPEFIIPFKITQEQAAQIYENKMKHSIFAPSYMKHMDIEKVRGIYMPYWTYNVHVKGGVHAETTESIPAPGGTIVNKYRITSNINLTGNGIEYDASTSFPDDLSQAAGPFDFKQAKAYEAAYMSGFYADRGNVADEYYAPDAQEDMIDVAAPQIAAQMHVSQGALKYDVDRETGADKAMYPVWFISARNKAENKVSYAVVNGQSGKIAADMPIDPVKLVLGMLLFAVPIFFLLYAFMVPTPGTADIIVMILSIIGFICVIISALEAETAKNLGAAILPALGIIAVVGVVIFLIIADAFSVFYVAIAIFICVAILESAKKKGGRVGKISFRKQYVPAFVLNIAAIVICIVLRVLNPFNDYIYYIGISAATFLSAMSYVNMFRTHNKTMLRSLPQLNKRGGDES